MDKVRDFTADDVALGSFGVMHMIAFWRGQPSSAFVRREIAKCDALLAKMNAVLDEHEPPRNDEGETYYRDEDCEKIVLRAVLSKDGGDGQ